MPKIGRNKPCPCGSGKKFKACCRKSGLGKPQESPDWLAIGEETLYKASVWLTDHYDIEILREFRRSFYMTSKYFDSVEDLPPVLSKSVRRNAYEWLIGDAFLSIDDEPKSVMALLTGPNGPAFRDEQLEWLRKMQQETISAYSVRSVHTRYAVWLEDLAQPERPLLRLNDKAWSTRLEVGDVLGLRLLSFDDQWIRTPAHYFFESVEGLERMFASFRELSVDPSDANSEHQTFDLMLIWSWQHHLFDLFGEDEMFEEDEIFGEDEIFDEGEVLDESEVLDEDPEYFIRRFEVTDWDRLSSALETTEDDIEGNRECGWTRFGSEIYVDPDDGQQMEERFWILSLNPTEDGQLEVVTWWDEDSEEVGDWLENLTGNTVRPLPEEVRTEAEADSFPEPPDVLRHAFEDLSPTEKTTSIQYILEFIFRDWANRPLFVLDGKTPRLAAKSTSNKKQVIGILVSFEETENVVARRDGRAPVDFQFLWRAVGLDREAELAALPTESVDSQEAKVITFDVDRS